MHLPALSAGGQAPRGRFSGAVHSVFRQACNIRLDDGRLLALLAPHLGNVPHGVRLDAPRGFAFADHFRVGRPVGCRADVLRVAGGGLAIDLGTAKPWQGELPARGVDLAVPQVARAWRAAWRAWQRNRPRLGRRDAVGRAVERRGVRLARAARALQPAQATHGLQRLIGCGSGLTPSGDDLIVGFLAGLWSTAGERPARRVFLRALCAATHAAAAATGDISRTYLTHATHGRFAEPLITLLRRIGEGAAMTEVDMAALAALRVGHTSGADGVFGLQLGLAVWAPQSGLPRLAQPSDGVAGLAPANHSSLRRDCGLPTAADAGVGPETVRVSGGGLGRRASLPAACPAATTHGADELEADGRRDLNRGLSLGSVNSSFGWSMRPWPSVSPLDRFAGTDSQGRMDQRTRPG